MLGWALNEEASIAAYIDRAGTFLAALTDDFELILIDDGSTDRTWEIATRMPAHASMAEAIQERSQSRVRATTRSARSRWQRRTMCSGRRSTGRTTSAILRRRCTSSCRRRAARSSGGTTSARGMIGHRSDNPYKGLVSVVNYRLMRTLFRLPLDDYQNVTVYPRP